MHVCNPAHVWTLRRLAIWSTFWLHTTFCFVLEPMQRLCHPAPYEPMQRLCHPVHFFCCMSKLFQQNTSLWFHTFHFRPAQRLNQWYAANFQTHFSHGTNRHTLPMTSSAMLKFNPNYKFQIPDSLFCFSLWATRQRKTTLPLYSSLRLLCKVPLLQISLNSIPAFW